MDVKFIRSLRDVRMEELQQMEERINTPNQLQPKRQNLLGRLFLAIGELFVAIGHTIR